MTGAQPRLRLRLVPRCSRLFSATSADFKQQQQRRSTRSPSSLHTTPHRSHLAHVSSAVTRAVDKQLFIAHHPSLPSLPLIFSLPFSFRLPVWQPHTQTYSCKHTVSLRPLFQFGFGRLSLVALAACSFFSLSVLFRKFAWTHGVMLTSSDVSIGMYFHLI